MGEKLSFEIAKRKLAPVADACKVRGQLISRTIL